VYEGREHEGKTIKIDGRKLLLDALNLIGISGATFKLGADKSEV
jgi:hypothetical protein